MTIDVIHMHRIRSSIYIGLAAFFAGERATVTSRGKAEKTRRVKNGWVAVLIVLWRRNDRER
jgi:hypothetical protein